MKIELFLWYLIPLLLSFYILIKSVSNSRKLQSISNYFITGILILVISFSQVIQYEIFFKNAYPTFLPQVFIVLTLIIVMIQSIQTTRRSK